jgi:hypothetical protein
VVVGLVLIDGSSGDFSSGVFDVLGTTVRAHAPENDIRLVDQVSGVGDGVEAGGVADGAVDVRDLPAPAADEMVMIVTDSRLVSGGTARGFYPAEQPAAVQRVQGVIDGLQGDLTDPTPNATVNGVHVQVVALPYGPHDRHPGRGHPQACLAKPVLVFHGTHAMA